MSVRQISRSIWKNRGNRGQRWKRTSAAIAWQLYKRVLRKPKTIQLASGRRMETHPDCVVSSSLIYADYPEFEELSFVRSRIKAGQKLIDVGANVGHVGLLLSDIVSPSDIVAFEPTPVSYRRLKRNWIINASDSMPKIYPIAIGAEHGVIEFPNTISPVTTNAVVQDSDSKSDCVSVELRTLDTFRADWNGADIGLLKIDVEGFEAQVFAGAQETLHYDRPRLIMFESLAGHLDKSIRRTFDDTNYRVFSLDSRGNPNFEALDEQNLFAVPAELKSEITLPSRG